MTIEEVEALLDEPEATAQYLKHPKAQHLAGLVEGLTILAKYEPDSSYNFDHEISYWAFSEDITREEALTLNALGFHVDIDGEGWARGS